MRTCEHDLAPLLDHPALASCTVTTFMLWIPHERRIIPKSHTGPNPNWTVRVDAYMRRKRMVGSRRLRQLLDRERIAILDYLIERMIPE